MSIVAKALGTTKINKTVNSLLVKFRKLTVCQCEATLDL
jgi:hypothetical protein